MFEALNSFWGGAVSLASGLLVLAAAGRLFSVRPKLIAYDFRSYQVKKVNVPDGVKVEYEFRDVRVPSMHITEVIIKNESGSPVSDSSFLTSPSIQIDTENVLAFARQVTGIDESFGELSLNAADGKLRLTNLTIPIDSSVTFEVATEKPIDQSLSCVHKDVKVNRRNYGLLRRSVIMYFFAPVAFWFIGFIFAGLLEITSGTVGFSIISFTREMLSPLKLNAVVEALASLILYVLFALAIVFIYRVYLGASTAERRFTEKKVQAN
jgi:hypothetical protein